MWSEQEERQLRGRITRQGQAKPVIIYRLISAGTADVFLNNLSFDKGVMYDAFNGCSERTSMCGLALPLDRSFSSLFTEVAIGLTEDPNAEDEDEEDEDEDEDEPPEQVPEATSLQKPRRRSKKSSGLEEPSSTAAPEASEDPKPKRGGKGKGRPTRKEPAEGGQESLRKRKKVEEGADAH
jgi:hypothetical protein